MKIVDCEPALIYIEFAMQTATRKQQQVLDFIERYQLKHGASPTVRETREHMRLKSDGFVVHCLKALEKKGLIKKGDTPRSIKLLPSVAERLHADFVKLPVLGTIPAGGPILSEEYIEDWVELPSGKLKHPKESFILRVRGESMIGAGIFEGDYVIANSKSQPKQNDIVVALVDGGSTVKRYKITNGKPLLIAENPKYKPIRPESELQIQGVVVGLFRWY